MFVVYGDEKEKRDLNNVVVAVGFDDDDLEVLRKQKFILEDLNKVSTAKAKVLLIYGETKDELVGHMQDLINQAKSACPNSEFEFVHINRRPGEPDEEGWIYR